MKIKRSSRLFLQILILFVTGLAILGCMVVGQLLPPANTPTPITPSVTPTNTPTPTATPPPQISIRLMAYNIWFGAGVNPGHAERGTNNNRLADLITVVKQANPDILGMEEVSEWDTGNPTTIEKFAKAVGMQYYMAPTWRGMNPAIFSKYPILETENLSEYVGNNGALRAVVQTPDGQKLNVVIVHLDPRDHVLRTCEFDKLRHIMAAYQDQPSILMGDINSFPGAGDTKHLTNGGWQLVQSRTIDNIFVFSHQAWSAVPICFDGGDSTPDCVGTMGISDHLPVGAVLSLYSFPNPASLPTPVPAATPAALPPDVAEVLTGVQVLNVTDNSDLPGCANAASLQQFLQPGQSALLRLRISGFDGSGSKLSVDLGSGLANQSEFLRYGLGGGGGGPLTLAPYTLTSAGNGSAPSKTGNMTMQTGKWYYLLIAVDKHGAFHTLVWDEANPSLRMEVDRPADPAWVRNQWKLTIETVGGKVELSQLQLLSFKSFP
jgi:endonuclease/exonuclease/phosphatase family metal-dependent hydrolase